MAEWTLDRILQQAQKGGVNRQQAEWLIAEVRRLREGIAKHQQQADITWKHDKELWSLLDVWSQGGRDA